MSTGKQATFVDIKISKGKYRENCKKVKTVKDGERERCPHTAKFKIEKANGETDYRCGMHISDYGALGENGTYERLDLD